MDFDFSFGPTAQNAKRRSEQRSSLVVLGNFCGENKADNLPLDSRSVSIDTLDSVMQDWQPQCRVTLPHHLRSNDETPHTQLLSLGQLDDLHADQLIQSIDWLRSLYSIWRNLDAPEQRAAALDALAQWQALPPADTEPDPATATPATEADDLSRLLGKTVTAQNGPSTAERSASSRLDALVQQAVAGATSATADDTIKTAINQCETLLTSSLRAALRDPGFQTVSQAWQSADWLLRRLDDDTTVTLINLPQQALYARLAEAGSKGLEHSDLQPAMERATQGAEQIVVVGLYSFGPDLAELTAAAQLAALAGRQGGVFAGHGELALAGCSDADMLESPEQWQEPGSDADAFWNELTQHAVAKHLFLATPQFILRQPFGPMSDPLESFPFEELSPSPKAEEFCWGSPALPGAIALLSGSRTFSDIPQPVFNDNSGRDMQLPIEGRVSERAASKLQAAGLQPLRHNPATGQVVI